VLLGGGLPAKPDREHKQAQERQDGSSQINQWRSTMKTNQIFFSLSLVLVLSLTACGILGRDTDLAGTAWSLVEVNGQAVVAGSDPTLVFEDGRAGGNASCNTFGSEFTATNGKLTFAPIESTLMYFDGLMDQDAAYLSALQAAAGYQISGGNLQILNADGQVTLVFAPQN
jgi:heat shock protein HslJ